MAKSDLVDLTLYEHYRTEKAILVSDDGDDATAVWLPLSVVEVEKTGKQSQGLKQVVVTLPERVALEKELI